MKQLLLIITLAFVFASCNKNEQDIGGSNGEHTELRLSAGIKVQTKATNNSWAAGDTIGVYMKKTDGWLTHPENNLLYNNRQYKTTSNGANTGFTLSDGGTPLYYPLDNKVDIIAYYPYKATITDFIYPISVKDQTTVIDFLYSNNAADIAKSNNAVNLQFEHMLAKVTINTKKGSGLSDAEFAAITLSITNLNTTAEIDLEDGFSTNSGNVDIIIPLKNGAQHTALLIPQYFTDSEVVLDIASVGTLGWIITTPQFESGKHYTYNITVNRTGVTLGSSDISDWEATTPETTMPEASIEFVNIPLNKIADGADYYTFLMGSPNGSGGIDGTATEPNRGLDETLHKVKLTKAYRMAKYEVTNTQWCAFLNAYNVQKPNSKITDTDPRGKYLTDVKKIGDTIAWFLLPALQPTEIEIEYINDKWQAKEGLANHPFINVSHYGAVAFCAFYGYRLPTEAEWEYACRAGSQTAYYFGDDASRLGNYEWYSANANNATHNVGTKLPNAFGLYDMLGNVQEWCADDYNTDYSITNINATDIYTNPQGANGNNCVIRGNYFRTDDIHLRSAYRTSSAIYNMSTFLGFRVVCD